MKEKIHALDTYPHFLHGGDYSPEQWLDYPEILAADEKLLGAANCNEWTVGIFSWAELEPREGEYDFSFLDDTFERAHRAGGKIILATPSGARPRWMAEKYEEVLRVSSDGVRDRFGARHNHCYSSPVYRAKTAEINRRLAERYGKDDALVCWHISNEYGGECYCPLCQAAFVEWLKEKYHNDIKELNDAWWTKFWSHTYTSFSEIEPPMPRGEMSVHGLNLDWRRFVSHQTLDFMENEIAPIRAVCPDIPVTTNMQYSFYGLNYNEFADCIDVASWDSYPEWHSGDDEKNAQENAFWHDFYRTLKHKPFLLMESTPSMVNWKEYNKPKRPGLDVLSSVQAIAGGSDSVQYFQWRKSRGSAEKLHGAVVGHDGGEDTRSFRSVKRTGEILKKVDEIAGTLTKADVAIIYDWENLWALDDAQGYAKWKYYNRTVYAYHKFFWKRGIACDIVPRNADLSKYSLVVAPMLYMTDAATIDGLCDYVSRGGTLYATYMLGTVDENDLCHLGGIPGGKLKDVFGIVNDECDVLYPDERSTVSCGGRDYAAVDFCEVIRSTGAEVLATYTDGYYAGSPALTRNDYGKGTAVYQAFRDTGDFSDAVLAELCRECGISQVIPTDYAPLPRGMSAHSRTDGENTYIFVENYSEETAPPLRLGREVTDMLSGRRVTEVTLPPYGFGIYKA